MKKSLSLLSCNITQKTMKNQFHTRIHGLRATLCRALLPLGLLLLAVPAFGQTYVGNASNCIGTITRSNDAGGKRMHYIKTGSTSGYFALGFSLGNNPTCGSHNITGYTINDFTVLNDTIYFCGDDANGVGFYGWARAYGLSWTYHIYKIYNSTTFTSSNISRIKVFRSGQDLNVLLIGTYRGSIFASYRSIFHIKNNDTCTVAYGDVEYFEDIAVLDDYVVAIARKKTRDYPHEPHYLRVLNKNSFTLNDTLFDYYHYWNPGIESVGNVRLQAMGLNNLVSVYCKDTAYYINTYSVNSNGVLSQHNYYTIATNTLPTIGDVAYSSTNKTLAVLHNIDTMGTAMFYDCTSFPNITLSSSIYPFVDFISPTDLVQTKLLSVTKSPSSYFVITGIYGNKPVFWKTLESFCHLERQMSVASTETYNSRAYGETHRTTMNIHYSSSPDVYEIKQLERKCY